MIPWHTLDDEPGAGAVTRSVSDILDDWKARDIRWVRFELPDIHGTARVEARADRGRVRLRRGGAEHVRRARRCSTRAPTSWRLGLQRRVAYADQLLRPGPAHGATVMPWEPGHGAVHLLRLLGRRHAARGLAAAAAGAGARPGPGDRVRDQDRRRSTRTTSSTPDGTPLFGGYHIFNPAANVVHPVVLELMEMLPKRRRRPDHGQRGVRARAVRAQLRAGRRPRGPGQGLHVQERRQGDRAQARADRHASCRSRSTGWPAAARTSTSRCSTRQGKSVMGADNGGVGHVRSCAKAFVAGNLKYAQGHLHACSCRRVNC